MQTIHTPLAPAAIGPYSQAVKANGLVFTSGQIALDPATGAVIEGGIREQTARICENLKAVLAAAGSSLDKTLKTTCFLADMNDFAAQGAPQGRARRSRGHRPRVKPAPAGTF